MAAETHVVPPSRPWGEAISAQRWWIAVLGVLTVVIMGFIIKPITSDLFVTQAMNGQRKGAVGTLVDALYYGLEPAYALVITLVVSAFVGLACKQVRIGLQCAVAIAVTWVPVVFVKMLIERPRPSSEMLSNPIPVTPGDWSFPSGHTTYVTALAMMLMLTVGARLPLVLRALFVLCAALGIAGVVLTMGVHYPTDVIAAVIWSTTVAPLVWNLLDNVGRRVSRCENASGRIAEKTPGQIF
ncbi:phosphatase PAP2 family protein [Corynebacterium ulcerans]|uniref:phosphatase PAP2 family protein n=1 Tax=Corynebacterium ulcerans TaxID=65058 RepID=UPI0005FEAE99|nr:phosphatase PAP2 family protein [Corynebacterium ulcerans]AKA95708.1 Phosphatidylglycerophosphatase B [Corynebacterium ulcerans]